MWKPVALGFGSLAFAAVASGCGGTPQAVHRASTPTTAAPTTTVPTTAAATTTVPESALPGVVADCTLPQPQGQQSQVKPASITVACADGGIGVEKVVWTSWTQTTATGNGEVWENDCTPDCAGGTTYTYRASLSLTDVKATTSGRVFSQLAVVYLGAGPMGHTVDRFSLPLPPV